MEVEGQKVFITGASGFIGGRLAEKLVLEHRCQVLALVRNFSKATWLSRTSVDMVYGDLSDISYLEDSMRGCAVVFHCAADLSSSIPSSNSTNVEGTRNLLSAAQRCGIKRFVHVSTAAVHRTPGKGQPVDEDSPWIGNEGDIYAQTKMQADQLASDFALQNSFPVVIVRPTIVYGPRSSYWTVSLIQRLLSGHIALPHGAIGCNNFIYVDELVDALILAATAEVQPGEAFIIGSDRSTSWSEYLDHYAHMAGKRVQFWPIWALKASAHAFNILDRTISRLRDCPGFWLRPIVLTLRGVRRLIRPWRKLGIWELEYFQKDCAFSIEKAKSRLGFLPTTHQEQYLADTETWLLDQCILPQNTNQRHNNSPVA